jgi:hypothetical protein
MGTVTYFAYPFGLWNKEAIPEVKERIPNGLYPFDQKRFNDPLHHQTYDRSGTWKNDELLTELLANNTIYNYYKAIVYNADIISE